MIDSQQEDESGKECPLADFVSSSGSEKIPYVYMPLKHQLVHPTAEVALLGLEHGGSPLVSPVCVVTKGSILTQRGWKNMANTSTFEPPFRLYRDGGRTYVQWVGEESARSSAEGRLVLVKLICRDAAQHNTPVFRPCLAFRVAGSPGASEAALSAPVQGGGGVGSGGSGSGGGGGTGLSSGEGIIIGLVVTCLAIIYVVGMTIYIKVKRRKKRERVMAKLAEEGGMRTSKSRRGRNKRRACPPPKPSSLISSDNSLEHEDIEDLSLASRARRANRERKHISFTTAVVHSAGESGREGTLTAGHDPVDGLERAHRSPFAVVETVGETAPGNSGARAIAVLSPEDDPEAAPGEGQDAQAKKKLYFNPAYFEPDMLQSPPPAALEFLSRIREMISVAKSKMKSKTYQPSLFDIPEEDPDGHSRSMSRLTNRSSSVTVPLDEFERPDDEGIDASDVTSIQSDSLERQRDSDSRSSTLKRLAKRVNSHGESFVSEIIKTLDLKPRLPRPESIYGSHPQKAPAPKPPPPRPVNARKESSPPSPAEAEDDFPELIKPSMLRNVLRDGKRLTDLNNTFENFRQEMMATFHKMKRVGEAISPKSSLSRSKNKGSKSATLSSGERTKCEIYASDGKVQKWLQTLESRSSCNSLSGNKNVIFDSRTAMLQNQDPPPLPQKNSKPPTPPRRNRPFPSRSISFSEVKEPSSLASLRDSLKRNEGCVQPTPGKNHITRSLSWQNEHRHYDSTPRRPRQQVPLVSEDSLNTSYGSEDDSLNDLVSEAESKVPKMTPSDSESLYSDTKSGCKDSLDAGKDDAHTNSKSLSRQLPREEEMTARNEVFNKRTGAKTMSRLAKSSSSDGPYQTVLDEKEDTDDYDSEHTYEEIQFSDGSKRKQKRKAPQKPKDKKHEGGEEERTKSRTMCEGDESPYEIYSNPDSLISEVTIEECKSPVYSGCTVTIPVADNVNADTVGVHGGYDQDTLERRVTMVDRNGSIISDSLERPKVKKKNILNNEDTANDSRAQRRMTIPNDTFKNIDKSLIHIYESRNSNRSAGDARNDSPERTYSPPGFSNPPSPTRMGSFYLNNISNNMNNNLNNLSCDNDMQKKYRTFKDYKKMRFQRGPSEPNTTSSPIPVTGTSINFNFRSSSPSNKEQRDVRPPLPPKQTRTAETTGTSSPVLPPKTRNIPPPLPLKTNRKSDSSDSENDRPKLPEKSRKKPPKDSPLSRSSSGGSIPELTEEEARSILHGLLAHAAPDNQRLSPLHEEDVEGNFLGVGNTAANSDSQVSVPCLGAFFLGSLDGVPSSSSSTQDDVNDADSKSLGRKVETSLDRQILRGVDGMEEPDSPESDARVSGEFILSTIGRSPSLRRQSSLNREPTNGFLTKLKDITDSESDGDAISKGMEIALALKAKSDLEKHFKEKSGADSIKRTWRKIIQKVDDAKDDKDKISIMQLQHYMASLDRKEKDTKLKQEDSGYHSTDSSESANSRNSHTSLSTALSTVSTAAAAATQDLPAKHPVRTSSFFTSGSLNRSHQIQRSISMHHLGPSSTLESPASCGFGSFQRASLRASMSRRFHESQLSGGLSVYINKCFASGEDIHGNINI
ncbi:uncharacterized protein sha [Panulirus ornatus]|uniref:uncharacterized protein sha n=1 Tax=Panulirus ornatus TaxID=150431 RepID=UPI003A8BC600